MRLSVRGGGRRYRGDRPLFATVSPGVPGNDAATVTFHLTGAARVTLEAVRTALRSTTVVWEDERALPAGEHELTWAPALGSATGSYVMRLTIERNGRRRVYGSHRPAIPERAVAPVVRVLGVEAAFAQTAYAPFEPMALSVLADTPSLTLTFLRCGGEVQPTIRSDEMTGVQFGDPAHLVWRGKRSAPATVTVQAGDWPTGLYAARLETPDGRVGFAPFVLRPAAGTGSRQAIVLPTHTWQAYNFYDRDGDGWGDTWYAGGNPPVDLGRPYRDRGVPPRYRRYDLPFLRWLHTNGLEPDFLTDDDLDERLTGEELRRRYDLIVFPGHTEYVTQRAYDAVERFRDLGGRLGFLSANNFFWRVDRDGRQLTRVRRWRDLGRPEARLIGAQYIANDDGTRQGSFVVTGADRAPWLFDGTGLANGSSLGDAIGGYGIEIDAAQPVSPPGTIVLARIVDLFGPGFTAEMTYYETPAGARVFAAGAMDFTGSAMIPPVDRLLLNLWQHLAATPAAGG